MKQALHILSKDIRRLWPQIAVVMLAIAYFTRSERLLVEFIVGAAVWFLIARTVHQESLTEANAFWLTRPYERGSLLGAKIMLAVLVVIVPLLIADCVILSAESFSVSGNFGGLVLRQLLTATWLILPPFAIASITRSITEDLMVWLVVIVIEGVTYLPVARDFRGANQKYALVVALALIVVAASRQYWRRGTTVSRALIAAAVLLLALPFPESMALAIGSSRTPEISGITVTPQAAKITSRPECTAVPLSMGRARSNWRLAVLSQNSTFDLDGGKTWNSGWVPGAQGPVRYGWADAVVSACVGRPGERRALDAPRPRAVHISVVFEVVADNPPVRVKATLAPFDVPGVGRCQFSVDPRNRGYLLACKTPVWLPSPGTIEISTWQGGYFPISDVRYAWTPMNLLPGFSPVYKWTTMPMDRDNREAIQQGGQLELTTETPIGVIRRDVDVVVK